jgi:hypothetical protein
LPDIPTRGPAAPPPQDQASGLRRIFEPAAAHWSLVLHPGSRAASPADGLAAYARRFAAGAGDTLLIDGARAQVAVSLGLRLRYDLQHVLDGDCAIGAACATAAPGLWVLPAARALDAVVTDERHAQRVAAAVAAVSTGMREAMLVVPAGRVAWVRRVPGLARVRTALIPVTQGADAGAAVLTAVRQAASDAEIDTFHLLFLGMGEATAGRLLSGMAAIARRHFGVTLLAARPAVEAEMASSGARASRRSVESVS